MIITKQKEFKDILKVLEGQTKVFIVGCGECSTTCKTGGEAEVLAMKAALEKEGVVVSGHVVPDAPCVAAQVRSSLAKHLKEIKEAKDATFDAAKSCNCDGKPSLIRAVRDLEKAEAEVEEAE